MASQITTVGRIVRYILTKGPSRGDERAATIVRVRDADHVRLQVHLDMLEDAGAEHFTDWCPLGGPDRMGTWFWPPRNKKKGKGAPAAAAPSV